MAAWCKILKFHLMPMLAVLVVVQLPLLTSSLRITSNRAGPYRIIFREITNCSIEGVKNFVELSFTAPHAGRQQYATGRVFQTVPLDDAHQMTINLDRRIDAEWKKNIFILRFGAACSSIRRMSPSVVKTLYGNDGKKCPISAAERRIHNQTINVVFPEIPVFPYGRWQGHIKQIQSGRDIGCFRVDVDVVPKKLGDS